MNWLLLILSLPTENATVRMRAWRMLKAAGQDVPAVRPILEININHPIVSRLNAETDDARFAEWARILFDQSLLSEGGELEDPASFVARLNGLLLELMK